MDLTLLFCQIVLFLNLGFNLGDEIKSEETHANYFVPTWVSGEVLNVKNPVSVQPTVYDYRYDKKSKPRVKIRRKRKRSRPRNKKTENAIEKPKKSRRKSGRKSTKVRKWMQVNDKRNNKKRQPVDIIVHIKMKE